MMLLAVFAALALVLAAVGIYSVMAYSVGQRTHEIGVRLAIGASRSDVMRLVLGQTLCLAGAGVVVGVAAAAGLTRLMRTLLFEVQPGDPVTLVAVVVCCWSASPARRLRSRPPRLARRSHRRAAIRVN